MLPKLHAREHICIIIHTHIQTYKHTMIHTCVHTNRQTKTQAFIQHAYIYIHTYQKHTYSNMCKKYHTWTRTLSQYKHTITCAHSTPSGGVGDPSCGISWHDSFLHTHNTHTHTRTHADEAMIRALEAKGFDVIAENDTFPRLLPW